MELLPLCIRCGVHAETAVLVLNKGPELFVLKQVQINKLYLVTSRGK